MSKTLGLKVRRMITYIEKGESEYSLEIAGEEMRLDPESGAGQLLMAVHYFFMNEYDETAYWLSETLKREPENDTVLDIVIYFYKSMNYDQEMILGLIEKGLRLYPENHLFHGHYAEICQNHLQDKEQALLSYQEALRLNPYHETYLGEYASLLFQKGKTDEAEKYEQLALRENPSNPNNLLNFAWYAFQYKKYNKANHLIEEAMRVEPTDEQIRRYYQKILPSKNPFVQTVLKVNIFVARTFQRPAYWLWKLSRGKVNYWILQLVVMVVGVGGLYLLLGKGVYVLFGSSLLLNIIRGFIGKSVLKAHGFNKNEQKELKKETLKTQEDALKEMRKGLGTAKESVENEQVKWSMDELEVQLAQIWETDQVAVLKDQANLIEPTELEEPELPMVEEEVVAKNPGEMILEEEAVKKIAEEEIEWPKEKKSWPVMLMLGIIIISLSAKILPGIVERINRPEPIAPEIQQSISKQQEELRQESLNEVEEFEGGAVIEEEATNDTQRDQSKVVAEQFMKSVRDGTLEQKAGELLSTNYAATVMDRVEGETLQEMASYELGQMIEPYKGIAVFAVSIVDEAGQIHAVLQIAAKQINHIYAEEWLADADEIEKYNRMKELFEEASK